jgi:hypothetical protein
VRESGAESASLERPDLFASVSPDARVYPTRVTGELRGVPAGEHRDLALAVNGRIRAVGRSFDFARKRREYYSFLVPEDALRPGANRLSLFEVSGGGTLVAVAGF